MDTHRSQYNNNHTLKLDNPSEPYSISNKDYKKVAENRSLYGNYVDNALAYDPNKDNKSVYDVVFASDVYDPWGNLEFHVKKRHFNKTFVVI
jgi:hypothetical protein